MRALTLVMTAILAGCASAPPKSETAPSTAPVASPDDTASTADDAGRAFQPPAGWRAKIVDWEVMYCRKGPIGGSRMTTELCLTEDQLTFDLLNLLHNHHYPLPGRIFNLRIAGITTLTAPGEIPAAVPQMWTKSGLWLGVLLHGTGDFTTKR